ncbi:hypothetical protein CO038_02520 [Candidatus Pacearchaeota archaeon CG_4_9_14_0_2_um_filter_39_13]|nr:hypothetical protein [Candidatus Pacearchaeota archaeon]OIO43559.1 MAG: hypothetical protein AUJ64_02080 [Candidatus Pacearchaeota archaeon CG1_02_39_14]PJC44658.1 MAG: hypothetical protein CO038_02520 [Candidatus Pacearchaeota archaeon CG_4_9_14_0_2_um_filter_39_13]
MTVCKTCNNESESICEGCGNCENCGCVCGKDETPAESDKALEEESEQADAAEEDSVEDSKE